MLGFWDFVVKTFSFRQEKKMCAKRIAHPQCVSVIPLPLTLCYVAESEFPHIYLCCVSMAEKSEACGVVGRVPPPLDFIHSSHSSGSGSYADKGSGLVYTIYKVHKLILRHYTQTLIQYNWPEAKKESIF